MPIMGYTLDMKLSQYAKRAGVTYKTAWRWWNQGLLDASQTPTGTVIVREPVLPAPPPGRVARYARVSSADQAAGRDRQLQHLQDDAAANGDSVAKAVSEMASGLNDQRPKLSRLLTDPTIGKLVVEQRERLTRFGAEDLRQRLATQGRQLDGLLPSDPEDELVDDSDPEDALADVFVAVLTSLAARLYGRRTCRPASSGVWSRRKPQWKYEPHPARLPGRTGPDERADHRVQAACGGSALGVQLGLATQARGISHDRPKPQCDGIAPRVERAQADRGALAVRGLQVCAS